MVNRFLHLSIIISLISTTQMSAAQQQQQQRAPRTTTTTSTTTTLNKNAVVITQKYIADRILTHSLRAQEINLANEKARLPLAQAQSQFDYKVEAETGYELNRFENMFGTQNNKDELFATRLKLDKPFSSGTKVGLEYTRNSLRSEFQPGATNTYPNTTTDVVGLTLEQNLWKNFFGNAQRAQLTAAEKSYEASSLARLDQLQDLVLDAIQQYWNTYVAQENFQEALNSRERYRSLVEVVRRKNSFGYTNPGELSRVQAELEQREQSVKLTSVAYLQQLARLLTLVRLPADTEVKFEAINQIPEPPQTSQTKVEELRTIRAAKLRLESALASEKANRSDASPDVSLVGKVYSQGLDNDSGSAWGESLSGKNPKYYVGVKFVHSFGSGVQKERQVQSRIEKELQQTSLERSLLELQDQEQHLQRQIQATYGIVLSSKTQKDLRERAAQELNRSYNQGRTDISILIESLNAYFSAGVAYSKAVGDYHIALNEWAAFQEKLVTGDNNKK